MLDSKRLPTRSVLSCCSPAMHVVDSLNEIIVVPITRTIRGLETEVVLTTDDGRPVASALNFDHVALAGRSRIGSLITQLPDKYWPDIERALLVACGFGGAR